MTWHKLGALAGLVGLTGILATGCGAKPAAVSNTKTEYTFAVVQMLNDPFFAAVERGAKAEAHKLGNVTIKVTGPGEADVSKQIADVRALVTQHVNGIILSPEDATALIAPTQAAVQAGIPVVLYNSTLNNSTLALSTIVSNNYDGGVAGGQYMGRVLGGHGQVAILEALTGVPVLTQRWNGFTKGLSGTPNVHVVAKELTNNNLQTAAATVKSLLVKYPHLSGIYADDIVNADGAIQALSSTGALNRVKVVAFDAEPEEVQLLKAGKLSALVAQKPYMEGVLAVKDLWDHLHHKPVSKSTNVGYVLMTRANLAKTLKWEY